MTESEMLAALRRRFAPGTWAFLNHVRNGTGWSRKVTRTADAIAMSLWPSRGLEVHGIEIKVSRADWVKELASPAKAEAICRFCDRWWVAVDNVEIVRPGELPPTWGLLIPRGGSLISKVDAPKLDAEPMDRLFIAALLRRATERTADEIYLKAEVEARLRAEEDALRERWNPQFTRLTREHALLAERVRKFKEASGVNIDEWREAEKIGEAVALVLRGGHENLRGQLENLRGHAERIVKAIEQEIADAGIR